MAHAFEEDSPATDEQLLVAARSDAGAFEEFYRRRVPTVIRFAARRSSSASEVADLVAAIWLEVVASIDRFDPRRGSALGWVLGIAAHLSASASRRRGAEEAATRRLAGLRLLDDDDIGRLEAMLDAERLAEPLLALMAALPPAEREVAELVLIEGLTPSDAAAALDVSAPAVRMRLARARKRLRDGAVLEPPLGGQEANR